MGEVQGRSWQIAGHWARIAATYRSWILGFPILFVLFFGVVPLGLTLMVSFWERQGFWVRPELTLRFYAEFFSGVRLFVLQRSLVVAALVAVLGLILAYPIAYFLAKHVPMRTARIVLLLIAVPFVVNYIIRNFSWVYLLGRTGPVNGLLRELGFVNRPVDWLLFGDFSLLIGLLTSYMPLMIYPLWLAIAGIDRQLVEASWSLGANPRMTFVRVTLPLSMPGIFVAAIFGFVGSFGESAVPVILGGAGYQLMGNAITSALNTLNYPLAAAMSSVVLAVMLIFLVVWYLSFDARSLLGKIVEWRM
jgi:ABC-type spermidine/putrescine transport system permease subunit I